MPFDPLHINGLTYDGQELRRAAVLGVMGDGSTLGARSGVRPGDPGLTTSLSGQDIWVSAGAAVLHRQGQGVYRAVLPAAWGGTLTAPHATLDRVDLVYLRVWDTDVDGAGLAQGDVVYLPGTASSTPLPPRPPEGQIALPLAVITVPHVGGGAPSVVQVRPVTVAPGGILPDPDAPGLYPGQYRDNGTGLERWDGTRWSVLQPLGVGQVLFARKTTDTSRSNTVTATDDPHLTVPVAANATYTLDAFLAYATSNVAAWKFMFALPPGTAQVWSPWGISDNSDTNSGGTVGRIRTSVTWGAATQLGVQATGVVSVRPVGLIRTAGASGTCTVQWAPGNMDKAATVMFTDSWIKLTRVA
ncbi:hypothetical protein AB0A77_28270 [Streptomyces varsoviensis]|uniref:hypothetical protein n=1 Tax=Streptomyces varsoviensis TaxID=67373 RepID=UPI0033CE63AB